MVNRINALVIVHVAFVLGLTSATGLAEHNETNAFIVLMPFMATGFSQCGLLGFWLAYGRASMQSRAWTSLFGGVYLWWLNVFATEAWGKVDLMIVLPVLVFGCMLFFAATLTVMRKWKPGVGLIRQDGLSPTVRGFQFSLRHLLLFTVAVSLVLAGAELMKSFAGAGVITRVLVCVVIVLCFVEGVLAALWASLGQGQVLVRMPIAVGLAALTGLIPAFYFRIDPKSYVLCVATAALAQVITVASLLVVRSAGFRLVRRLAPQIDSEERAELVGHPLD